MGPNPLEAPTGLRAVPAQTSRWRLADLKLTVLQHQMRNKIGIIAGTFELMHPPGSQTSAEQGQDIDRIGRAMHDLVALVDRLAEAGGAPPADDS